MISQSKPGLASIRSLAHKGNFLVMKIHPLRKVPPLLIVTAFLLVQAAGAQDAQMSPLKQKEAELRSALAQMQDSVIERSGRIEQLPEEDREILQMEEEKQALQGLETLYALVDNLLAQEAGGIEAKELRAYVSELMDNVPDIVIRSLDRYRTRLERLRTEKQDAGTSELGILEEHIGSFEHSIDKLFEVGVRHVAQLDKLGLDTRAFKEKITELLNFRVRLVAGRLKKLQTDRAILKNRSQANPDDADLALRLGAVQVAINHSAGSLDSLIRVMQQQGMDTTTYKTILIQSTGDISRGFELGVIWKIIANGWKSLHEWVQRQLPGVLTKLFIFTMVMVLFHLLARLVQKAVTRAVESSRVNVSRLLGRMIANTSYRLLMLLGILMALAQIGFSLTPLLAGLGVAGFIVGFALQDTLGNFASGLMILFYRPFDENDVVEAGGVRGRVNKMSLVSTTILTLDNQTLVVPNSKIWGDVICNLTDQDKRRVDLVFGVSYSSDIPQVERVIREVLDGCAAILPEPEPQVKVHELADSSVNFIVRPWVKTEDYWETYWYLTREVKMRFDKEGIVIPFPQRDVHHYNPEGTKR